MYQVSVQTNADPVLSDMFFFTAVEELMVIIFIC